MSGIIIPDSKEISNIEAQIGSTDISSIGDGTLSGAISSLNTSFANFNGSKAGHCNSRWGGRNLDQIYTFAQLHAKLASGDFSNLGIGDYYEKTVNSVTTKWRIAAADYFLHHGSSETTAHHLVMVPDACIGTSYMNSTDVTTGGYIGSYMYSTTIPSVNSWVSAAFGSSYMLAHDELLSNAVDTGKASSGYTGYTGASSNWGWKSMTCNIMSEPMVYGGPICSSSFFDTGNRHNQLPLFKLAPGLICNRAVWWLSSVADSTAFCSVVSDGNAAKHDASIVLGVRPYFLFY